MLNTFNTTNLDCPGELSFPVDMQNLYATSSDELVKANPKMAMAVVNQDSGHILGVHTSSYQIVSHKEVWDSIAQGITQTSLPKDITVEYQTTDPFASAFRADFIFNNLVIEPKVDDIIKYRIRFYNSYDGTFSINIQAEGLRLWCLNGCTTPHTVSSWRARHTRNVSVDAISNKIMAALNVFHNHKEIYQDWMSTPLDMFAVNQAFIKVCKYKSVTGKIKTNEKMLHNLSNTLEKEIDQHGRNLWALYNCLTYWQSHVDQTKQNPTLTEFNRRQTVVKMLGKDYGLGFYN